MSKKKGSILLFEQNKKNISIADQRKYLNLMLNNTQDAIFELDADQRIIFWNRSAERIYGFSAEEVLGRNPSELFWTGRSADVIKEKFDSLKSNEEIRFNIISYTKDSRQVVTETHLIAVSDKKGEIAGYTAVNREITEHSSISTILNEPDQARLSQSEEGFRIAQEVSIDGFSIFKPRFDTSKKIIDFVFTYQNSAAAHMNGTTNIEVIGRGLKELFQGIENTKFYEVYKRVIETGETIEFEEQYIGGLMPEEKWFRIVVVPAGGAIAVLAQDITDRKKAEEAQLESETKLLDGQKLANLCSFTFDFEKNNFDWTDEFFNIYEIDTRRKYFSVGELMNFVHPDDRNFVLESVKNAVDNKKDTLQMDYRIITGHGNLKYVSYKGRLFYDCSGKHTKRFGTIMDITARKLHELELKKMLEELQRSNRDLEQFAYAATHDLQEPLRMISAYSNILKSKLNGSLDEASNHYFEILIESSKRIYTLILGLLEYAHINSASESFVNTDLNAILEDVLKDLSELIRVNKAEVYVERLPVLKLVPLQMKQLFRNLILNAVKFKSEHNPCIHIKSELNNGSYQFSIKDNGIGINQKYYEKIFVLFQKLHTRDVSPGTGIGLSICKKIVEHHGGKIWVESEPGQGTTFYFSVPALISAE
jgi:PAS domain S-box-containing protein